MLQLICAPRLIPAHTLHIPCTYQLLVRADRNEVHDELVADLFSEAESLLPPIAYSETRPSATRLSSTDSSTLRYQVFSPGVQRRTPWSSLFESHVSE